MNTQISIHSLDNDFSMQSPDHRQGQAPCPETVSGRVEVVYPLSRKNSRAGLDKCLAKQSLLELRGDHRGEQVSGVVGTVWITQAGRREDIYLQPGEVFDITGSGAVLIQGMQASQVKISHPARGRQSGRALSGKVRRLAGWLGSFF